MLEVYKSIIVGYICGDVILLDALFCIFSFLNLVFFEYKMYLFGSF